MPNTGSGCRILIRAAESIFGQQLVSTHSLFGPVYTGHAMDCIFCKIIEGTIPSKPVYQDEHTFAFADINPKAPVHLLIVPREHIASLSDADSDRREVLGHLLWVAGQIADQKGLGKGYRVVVNTGEDGGQTVDHLHLHLLGGRSMTWPPG